MDISKASNFERFVFDLVGRDPKMVRELWASVDQGGSFDLSQTSYFKALPQFGFVSGKSTARRSSADDRSGLSRARRDGRPAHGRRAQGGAGVSR